jgi:ubiquitin-protein ligase
MADARPRRVLGELKKLQASVTSTDPSVGKLLIDKSPLDDQENVTSNTILGRILPNSDIYNQATFQIEITLGPDHPFKPSEVRFTTSIYHPSVDKDGKICVDIINGDGKYNSVTPMVTIVNAVTDPIDHPQIDHSLNPGKSLFFFREYKKYALRYWCRIHIKSRRIQS